MKQKYAKKKHFKIYVCILKFDFVRGTKKRIKYILNVQFCDSFIQMNDAPTVNKDAYGQNKQSLSDKK